MASEYVLRLRIEEAVKAAERANKNRDIVAYDRAKAKYEAASSWLTRLENERPEKACCELEARARRGLLPHAQIVKSGIPLDVLGARGWAAVPGGMRKPAQMDSVNDSAGPQAREEDRDDATANADGEHAKYGPGDECA